MTPETIMELLYRHFEAAQPKYAGELRYTTWRVDLIAEPVIVVSHPRTDQMVIANLYDLEKVTQPQH
jgi:hypothetical protein